MSEIILRRYRPDDVPVLVDLFRRSVREVAVRDYSEAQVRAWAPDHIDRAAFAQRRESKPTWIAEYTGQIAGFSDLEADGHIDMLYVHPHFQRRGVAQTLLAHIERTARDQGLARVYTEASLTARPVLEKRGYRVLATQTVPTGGAEFVNYRMEKAFLAV